MSSSNTTALTVTTDPNDPTNAPLLLADCYAMDRTWWHDHTIMTLLLIESINLWPPLFRMIRRAHQRRPHPRPNMSESLFFWIYFMTFMGCITKFLNWYRAYPTQPFCHVTAWMEAAGIHLGAGVVPLAMAQRAIAVWSQGGVRRWPFWLFTTLGLAHFGFIFVELYFYGKPNAVEAGSCATPQALVDEVADFKPWQYIHFYYLLWSISVDASITAATIYKLITNKGPYGWLGFSRLLLDNSIHYFTVVTAVNVTQFASFWFPSKWNFGDSTELAFSIACLFGMRLLAKEQDYAHGHRPPGSELANCNLNYATDSPQRNGSRGSGGCGGAGSRGLAGKFSATVSRFTRAGTPKETPHSQQQEAHEQGPRNPGSVERDGGSALVAATTGGRRDRARSRSSGASYRPSSAPASSKGAGANLSRENSSTSVPMLPFISYLDSPRGPHMQGGSSIHRGGSNQSKEEGEEEQRGRPRTTSTKQSSSGMSRGECGEAEGEHASTDVEPTLRGRPAFGANYL